MPSTPLSAGYILSHLVFTTILRFVITFMFADKEIG